MPQFEPHTYQKRSRFFPFWMMPGSWGLSGETRTFAEIDYHYPQKEAERLKQMHGKTAHEVALLNLDFDLEDGKITPFRHELTVAELKCKQLREMLEDDFEIGVINKETFDEKIEKNEQEFDLKKLDIKLRKGEIAQAEYDKERANLLDEPWMNFVRMELDQGNPSRGAMELDWNDAFIEYLSNHGYTGTSDEDLVNNWINDICRVILIENAADMNFGLEDVDDSRRRDSFEGEADDDSDDFNTYD